MQIQIYGVGSSPLLMNRMGESELLGLWDKSGKKPKSAGRPLPRDWADSRRYATKDGKSYLPTENVFSCLVAAGQQVRLDGKRQVSTAKSTILPSFLTLLDAFVPLVDPDAPGKEPAWEVDMRQGRNPNGGEAVCVIRPRFDRWAFTLNVDFDDREVGEPIVRELFDKAGSRIGLGDFRPARKGPFGRWVINRWQREEVERAAAE